MLLPAGPQGGKQMPAGVAFALSASEIARLLTPTGVTTQSAAPSDPLTPAAMADMANGITVLVSCWE
jgi:hypothetical protein